MPDEVSPFAPKPTPEHPVSVEETIDPDAPPHEGEERRGLWSPRRKPGSLFGGDLGAGGTPHRAHAGVGLVWSQQIWLWVPVELRPVDRNGWIGARRKG